MSSSRIFSIGSASGDSLNGTKNSHLRFSVPGLINHQDNIDDLHFYIVNATFPNSFYLIDSNTDELYILQGGSVQTYQLTHGNYNAQSMLTEIMSLLPEGFGMTYAGRTGKYTLTHSSEAFSILYSSPCAKILGLSNADLDNTAQPLDTGFVLEFPYRINFFPSQLITIRSATFGFSNHSNLDGASDLLATIPNNANANGMVVYNGDANIQFRLSVEQDISSFDIRIADQSSVDYDFQNSDWTITFAMLSNYAPRRVKIPLDEFLSTSRKRQRADIEDYLAQQDQLY